MWLAGLCVLWSLKETENSTNANLNFPAHHFSKNRQQRTKTSSQLHRLNCIYWKVHHLSAVNTDWHHCTNHSHISDISSWFTLPCSFIWSNDSSVSNGIDKIVMRHLQAAFFTQAWLIEPLLQIIKRRVSLVTNASRAVNMAFQMSFVSPT